MLTITPSALPRLPAEWEPQDAVLLVWPHADSDWVDLLDDVVELYQALIQRLVTLCGDTRVILVVPVGQAESISAQFAALQIPLARVHLFEIASDDTWARDSGPITVEMPEGGALTLQDYTFNGWGNKFSAEQDNRITANLSALGAFGARALRTTSVVMEGGAIESDGRGTLLTTKACLLNSNRNPSMSLADIETELQTQLGVQKINWLSHGYLAGDDTDSHIDTLARLCSNNTIVYVACDQPEDEHYTELTAMAEELATFTNVDGDAYTLLPLPWPQAVFSDDGHRLPATYANFLIINNTVLVPTYNDPKDAEALAVVAKAFPGYTVAGLDCRCLIEQHGSLHCITMQLPKGLLAPLLNHITPSSEG